MGNSAAAGFVPEVTCLMRSRSLRRNTRLAEWRVRYAEPAEFDDVAALLLRANAEYRAALPAAVFRAYRDDLRALALGPAAHDDCEILVIGDGARGLLGTVAFFPDAARAGLGWPKNWAGLRALAVDPAARGLGLGRRLSEAAIGRAQAIGAPILALHNAAFQIAARRLYLDLGFTRCPQYDFDAGDLAGVDAGQERILAEAFTLKLR